jgi:hypothetical protein
MTVACHRCGSTEYEITTYQDGYPPEHRYSGHCLRELQAIRRKYLEVRGILDEIAAKLKAIETIHGEAK